MKMVGTTHDVQWPLIMTDSAKVTLGTTSEAMRGAERKAHSKREVIGRSLTGKGGEVGSLHTVSAIRE